MKITAVKTAPVIPGPKQSLLKLIAKGFKKIPENSILVITSKIVSICEGNFVDSEKTDKKSLIKKNAEFYIPPEENQYGTTLTIKNSLIVASSGIDESNADGKLILWPKNSQKKANDVRTWLQKKFKINKVGVIITDSRNLPLRRGTTGASVAFSGFRPLNDYRGKKDIFGRKLSVAVANVADSLAAAAVAVMGEGQEQTPFALIEDLSFVSFVSRNPSKAELAEFNVSLKEDLYSSIISSAHWRPGGKK